MKSITISGITINVRDHALKQFKNRFLDCFPAATLNHSVLAWFALGIVNPTTGWHDLAAASITIETSTNGKPYHKSNRSGTSIYDGCYIDSVKFAKGTDAELLSLDQSHTQEGYNTEASYAACRAALANQFAGLISIATRG